MRSGSVKIMRTSKFGACCVAFGCSMRSGTNLISKIKMHRFPSDPIRRRQWEAAVRRKNWHSNSSSRICGLHFVTRMPSNDPSHPDYIPSVFSYNLPSTCETKVFKYGCSIKRENCEAKSGTEEREQSEAICYDIPKTKEATMMTDLTAQDIAELERLKNVIEEENVVWPCCYKEDCLITT